MARTIIKQAEHFDRVITLKYSDTGDYVDLIECTAYCQMRTKPGGVLVATAFCIIEPTLGRISASFSSEDTAEIAPGDYGFDIWLVSEGVAKPVHTEQVTVVKRYTENFEVGG